MLRAFLALFLFSAVTLQAQVVTTLHHNGQTTVFYNQNGLIDAYTASVNGDTIYLSGGHFTPVTIDKRLTIFGAGHYPDSTTATDITNVDGNLTLNSNADNSHLEGLRINGHFYLQSDSSVNNVTISRCYITGRFYASGNRTNPCMFVTIKESVIGEYLSVSNFLQCDVSNCIIYSEVDYAYNCSFRNNIFFSSVYFTWPYYCYYNFYDCDNCLIENNVFLGSNYFFIYCDNSLVRNNIFTGAPSGVAGSLTLTANYTNISSSSIFVNYTNTGFTYTDNYHLQSPGTYLGSDGSQAGIFGGAYPYKPSAVPVNPHIRSVFVPATTDSNGNLNINVQAGAQQE